MGDFPPQHGGQLRHLEFLEPRGTACTRQHRTHDRRHCGACGDAVAYPFTEKNPCHPAANLAFGESLAAGPPGRPGSRANPLVANVAQYDAVTLFADRAVAAVPGFTLTESNAAAVEAIYRRTDGLSVPVELAAARLRAMSPEQILQRLPPSRCGADLAADELLDTLSSVVKKSIVIPEEHGMVVRFRMLESLPNLVTRNSNNSVRLSLAPPATGLVRGVRACIGGGVDQRHHLDWIARLWREQPDLRGALDFSVDDDPARRGCALQRAVLVLGFQDFFR